MNRKILLKLGRQVWKYKSELFPPFTRRSNELVKRFWRIYVRPPLETKQYVDLEAYDVTMIKIDSIRTGLQPKQVAVTQDKKYALVTCMEAKKIQVFSLSPKLTLIDEMAFSEQCVEIVIKGNTCFVTTTDFEREKTPQNHLWIIDIPNRKVLSSVPTGGNWSKVIAITPDNMQILISNWKSNTVSVIDISNLHSPKLSQILEIKKCPRGIGFTSDGKTALISLFHSGNIAELKNKRGKWEIAFISKPFDEPRYAGNPRHVLISANDRYAYLSNQGRNLINVWNIANRVWEKAYLVGKGPKTIAFVDTNEKQLLVTCSGSDRVCLVDTQSGSIVGVSQKTGALTTGLCPLSKTDFLVTGFEDATLERFRISGR